MGMYTEIFFRAEVDDEAYNVIRAIHNREDYDWPDHPFFRTDRFDVITTMSSYYFPQANHVEFARDDSQYVKGQWVSFRSNLKNYDGEIEKFFDWVSPHCRSSGYDKTFIGYSQYEEADEPTIRYKVGD